MSAIRALVCKPLAELLRMDAMQAQIEEVHRRFETGSVEYEQWLDSLRAEAREAIHADHR